MAYNRHRKKKVKNNFKLTESLLRFIEAVLFSLSRGKVINKVSITLFMSYKLQKVKYEKLRKIYQNL